MKTKQKWAKEMIYGGTPMLAAGTPSSIGTPVVRTIKKFALKMVKKKG